MVSKLEKERWKVVQLRKKIKEVQENHAILTEEYAQAYALAATDANYMQRAQQLVGELDKASHDINLFKEKVFFSLVVVTNTSMR